ncbi:MAG: GGDEF domain-containing protein [Microlunatus sp.]|nr:GGDEF domain-containing protein [Microlunatus sp.]
MTDPSRRQVVASVVLAVVLSALGATTLVALFTISQANERVSLARLVASRYVTLQQSVAAQGFSEAAYRRAPSPAARQRLNAAIASVPAAASGVSEVGADEDQAVMARVIVLNRRYATEIQVALDTTPAGRTDDRVAGPTLDAISGTLNGVASQRQDELARADGRQGAVIGRLRILLPAVLLVAFGLLSCVFRSMTAEQRRLRAIAAKHEERSLTDHLTGLPNRASLNASMYEAFCRPRTEAALMYLDLDRFKPVNDSLGHQAGDTVLREVAKRLRSCIRAGEIAARVGGDEFAVFLPRGRDAEFVARRIMTAFEAPFSVDGHTFDVGVSIGLAHYPVDALGVEMLVVAADEALYRAKRAGRGTIRLARMSARARRIPAQPGPGSG